MRQPDGTIRKLRRSVDEPGHAHELTFSCYRSLPLLSNDSTRLWLLDALRQARSKLDLELWAYVIMPEHVHILLLPCADTYRTSSILQAIKQPVSRRALHWLRRQRDPQLRSLRHVRRNGHVGYHFWQPGGGYDRNITSPRVAWQAVDYIHNNPVRRGLVDGAVDWPWSSARWYAGCDDVQLAMDGGPPDP